MSGFRSGIVTTHLPMASQRRVNAASEALYARPPVATDNPVVSFDPVLAGTPIIPVPLVDYLYVKRLSPVRAESSVLKVQSWAGDATGLGARVVFAIYRIDAVRGTGTYEGQTVPELRKIWSYVITADMVVPRVWVQPPQGVAVSSGTPVDDRGPVLLSPNYDYAFGVGFDTVLNAANVLVAPEAVLTNKRVPMGTGWTDAPDIIRVEDLTTPVGYPYLTEIFMNSSLSVSIY